MGTTVIGGMLAATLIAVFLIPVMFYVIERFATNRSQRGPHGGPAGESQIATETS
jgi:HAE1 family hydrophobic/amphiphilic exporter-1